MTHDARPRNRVPAESDLILNVVWTGEVFPVLKLFVQSQMAHTTARFRFVANWCPPEQIELMEDFRRAHPDQVVEVLDVSPDIMESHGEALERTRALRDDGDWFCFIDPDIKANGPWVGEFLDLMADHEVVTSGTEVWTTDNVVPENTPGVAGEHFFARNGFTFGSPHLAFYRVDILNQATSRWGARLGSAGPDLRPDATQKLRDMGWPYLVWDTAKLVNVFIQAEHGRLVHRDLPQLMHIGGLSHFVSPAYYITNDDGEEVPEWMRWGGSHLETRLTVTRFTAGTIRALMAGRPTPPFPTGLTPDLRATLELVCAEATDLVGRYGTA